MWFKEEFREVWRLFRAFEDDIGSDKGKKKEHTKSAGVYFDDSLPFRRFRILHHHSQD